MKKLYRKNEVIFAIIMIVIYVVGTSIAESITASIGIEKLVPTIFHVLFTAIIFILIKKNGLEKKYGLVLPEYKLNRVWFFIPLAITACFGLVCGVEIRYSAFETVLFVISMLCVGFLEEVIFRGFLFVGMAKKNLRAAVIVSSITFGIGHIVNLFNGQNMFETIVQIIFAVAVGFVLVILFYKGKSLVPCIIFHGVNNALSAFEKTNAEAAEMLSMSVEQFEMAAIAILIVILSIYGIFILLKSDLSEVEDGTESNPNTGKRD